MADARDLGLKGDRLRLRRQEGQRAAEFLVSREASAWFAAVGVRQPSTRELAKFLFDGELRTLADQALQKRSDGNFEEAIELEEKRQAVEAKKTAFETAMTEGVT